MCISSKSNAPKKKVVQRAYLSVELNLHPNRQFLGLFVVHMPLCLHDLLCVAHLSCSGMFPLGGGVRIPWCAGDYYSGGGTEKSM